MAKRSRRRKRRRPIRRRTAPGASPGSLVVDPRAPKPVVTAISYDEQHYAEETLSSLDALQQRLGQYPVTWVNVDGLGDAEQLRRIGEMFGIHRLALEDVVNTHQRSKVEPFGDQLFIVARMPERNHELDTEQISLYLGRNFVVTFQERTGDCFEPVRQRIRAGGRIRAAGPDYLAYALIDAVVDSYFPFVETLIDDIEALEQQLFVSAGRRLLEQIHGVRRDVLLLRRAIWPHRDAIHALVRDRPQPITPETAIYLRDCYDHTLQIIDLIDTHHEVTRGLMDLYLNRTSHRMNDVMRVLTVMATIFMPITFVAGVYGMNFDPDVSPWNMPELEWRFGYPASLGLMAAIAAGMTFYFHRKGWLRTENGTHQTSDPTGEELQDAPAGK